MDWKELMVIKEVRDNITKTVEQQFDIMSSDCEFQGPEIMADWSGCKHKDHPFHHHSYQMCRWDYCPRLKR